MINKHELVEQLQNGVVTVIFEKRDGTERTMHATLLNEYIPEDKKPQGVRETPENNQTVWDVDLNDWRSFRLDSVKQVLNG